MPSPVLVDDLVASAAQKLDRSVQLLLGCEETNQSSAVGNSLCRLDHPIVHVFSHIRHTIYIETAKLRHQTRESNDESRFWETTLPDGETRTVAWMSELNMSEVGITTNIKKIIAAVANRGGTAKRGATKRKRVGICADDF